jgi:SSS family solute:Na+ symporter
MSLASQLGSLDFSIFIGYFVVALAIGFWAGRKKKETSREFFLTSGTLSWAVIGFSTIGASLSTEQLVGVVGYAYTHGMAVANWEWINFVGYSLLIWVFLPLYARNRIVTMPEFLELRFNATVRKMYAVISVLSYVFINLAGVVFSGAFLLNQMLGAEMWVGIWSLTILAGTLTVYGGMSSVAWTQVFQSALLIGAGLLVFFLGLAEVPGGLAAIVGEGRRAHLILPASDPDLPWTAMVVLALSTGPWYFCTNQYINQNSLGAKNEWHARMGILLACFLGIFTALAYIFPGLVAYAINPNLASGDEALPFLLKSVIPSGLKGLILAGLCGAIMSTIQALINSSATILTVDLYKGFGGRAPTEKQMIRFGRLAGVGVLVVGGLWAPVVASFGSIFSYFQECWFLIAAPIMVIFLLAVFWGRATSAAATWTLGLCFPMFILPYFLRIFEVQMNAFNIAGIVFVLSLVFMVVVSLYTEAPDQEKIAPVLWNPSILHLPKEVLAAGYPVYRYVSLWWVITVGIFVLLYIIYW